jgi:hypothetical protein
MSANGYAILRFNRPDASPPAALDGFAEFCSRLTAFETENNNPFAPQDILIGVRLLHKVAEQNSRLSLCIAEATGERQKTNISS